MVNETQLLQKYNKDIRRIVNSYLSSMYFPNSNSFYEDLISEATLAFLEACRSFHLDSPNLSDLQRTMCKNKILSALRVYIWKMHNMGGYNNRKIDLSRSVTFSDVLANRDQSIDDLITSTHQDDYSTLEVADFLNQLPPNYKNMLTLLMEGFGMRQIENTLSVSHQMFSKRLKNVRKKYLHCCV